MDIELLISGENGTAMYQPVLEEGIEWTTERRSTPGKLTFSVLDDGKISFSEGSAVRLRKDGKNVFFGYVFTQRRNRSRIIDVTAYDQLRYLQNKDTYVYENKTAAQLVGMIAADFSLKTGILEDTGFVIASRVEDNTSLFDMIENALDLTLANKKGMYVLYDDFGRLTLKNVSGMYVNLLIDEAAGENYDYTSTIDSGTYNKVKLAYNSKDNGKRQVYIAQDSANIDRWGVLQYYGTLSKGENGQAKAKALLSLYNAKNRSLKITGAFGDIRVRAGSMVPVNLDLGDVKVKRFMMAEKVKHRFEKDAHFMDLTLVGGEFGA